jgi:SH3-like domain-containing protein
MNRSALVLIICVAISSSANAKMMSVKSDKATLLSGPGKNFSAKYEYDKGFPVKVISSKGDWVKIEDFESESGWINKATLAYRKTVIVKANKNTENKINIRSGPGNTNTIIGQAYYGVVFEKLEQKSDWVKVQHDSGLTGWVINTFLWGN